MGMRIMTNIQSLVAQRHLTTNTEAQRASLERLSSGNRINKSADDAAGLAISEKIRADVRSLGQDLRNAEDGIGMIQVAEGGMREISNILVRLRELSIQGASDTVGDRERGFIDKEVQQLILETNRIALSTEFNGRKLLNGEGGQFDIQVGLNNNELDRFSFDTSKTNVTSDALGITGVTTGTKEASQANLETVDKALTNLSENRATVGALQNRLVSTISNIRILNENLSAARSRIADVDFASETAENTQRSILAQAGTAVLSQANTNNQLALRLLS